ncbi:MAG: DEAD/DEAH box helicase [Nanoarchaeota archaeon]|nr:DEAD/DEAH box helicase [Nanoarchaeota archaeon]MBU1704798.1 DEAD/DEAH box helicase [Nanoarchaeota archaeon]
MGILLIRFEPRLYQQTIFNSCTGKNTLVVLPTGMGKTNIFLMLAAHRLKLYPNSKILFIGPTRPLIDQYLESFKKDFEISESQLAVFTGNVKPEKREELWKSSKIIFSTPQGLENDIISRRIKLEEVSLLGVDEAHRAVGDYAYVFVAKQYQEKAHYPRILALTASPGSDIETISEVCKNLYIEDIEVRTDDDPDVKPYIQDINIEWVKVDLPQNLLDTHKYLKLFLTDRLEKLKALGLLHRTDTKFVSKADLLQMQGQLRSRASQEKDYTIWSAISVLAEIMKMQHALELLETQGVAALHAYLQKLNHDGFKAKTKAIQNIVKDLNFRTALIKTEKMYMEKIEHPKLIELQNIVEAETLKDPGTKMIIFNQYRDNAVDIVEKLNALKSVKANLFVGQTKKGESGMTQKVQKEVLDKFRAGEFNVLVATSVAEEGLDIPRVDLVIFYEPIPSAIRHIQRRGRTGRQEKGRVIILMTKDTRDEGYRWSAHHKEKRMHRTLKDLKSNLAKVIAPREVQERIDNTDETIIFADHREKASGVIKELINLGIRLNLDKLESADYLLSSRVGVEFKTTEDFVNSIIDGRLLMQTKGLKHNFERPLIIIEGDQDIYSIRNIHANSIRGMLATIAVSYGVPMIYTKNPRETASLLQIIAKREQQETGKNFTPHSEKRVSTLKEQQEYFISSLPGIGMTLAKPLLKGFGSVKSIINAEREELEKIEKIGPKKAEELKKVFDSEYKN